MTEKNKSFKDVFATEQKHLEEGKYKGLIVDISRDTEKYDYTRYKIDVKDEDITLSVSYPTAVSFAKDTKEPSSQHADFLSRMGYKLNLNESVNDFIYS